MKLKKRHAKKFAMQYLRALGLEGRAAHVVQAVRDASGELRLDVAFEKRQEARP